MNSKNVHTNYGARMKAYRARNGFTQMDAAKAIGVGQRTVAAVEGGPERQPQHGSERARIHAFLDSLAQPAEPVAPAAPQRVVRRRAYSTAVTTEQAPMAAADGWADGVRLVRTAAVPTAPMDVTIPASLFDTIASALGAPAGAPEFRRAWLEGYAAATRGAK